MIFAMIPEFKQIFFRESGVFYVLGSLLKNVSLVGIVRGQMMMGSNIL
jgi:hypothetical protein